MTMDERARFQLAGRATIAALVLWLGLAIGVVVVLILGVRSVLQHSVIQAVLAILAAVAIYVIWLFSTSYMARLLTNDSKGYRPWEWGMVARNEVGRDAQRFNIPLTYTEAKESFVDQASNEQSV